MNADPAQINLFLINLNALRITTTLDFCLHIETNLSFAYRLKRSLEVTVEQAVIHSSKSFRFFSGVKKHSTQKPVPRWAALPLFVICCSLLMYTDRCVSFSKSVCKQYPECVVYAHRATNHQHLCPCLVFLDIEKAPKNYDEWENMPDATEKVKLPAASGDLRVVEVINWMLVELPGGLHKCRHLRHMYVIRTTLCFADHGRIHTHMHALWMVFSSLIHSCTESIPTWVKDLEKLEFLDVEGKSDVLNLVRMPDDLFSEMSSLTYVHFGVHDHLQRLPSFKGLTNLKSLSLALVTSLQEPPSREPLKNLERLELLYLHQVQEIPGLAAHTDLSHLVILDTAVCCNGRFGVCNHAVKICSNATCLITDDAATLQLVLQFNYTVSPAFISNVDLLKSPGREQIDICEGVMFRQCAFSANKTRICYNDRLQVIACTYSPVVEEIRRRQTLFHVGIFCDPVEEKWLGCTKE